MLEGDSGDMEQDLALMFSAHLNGGKLKDAFKLVELSQRTLTIFGNQPRIKFPNHLRSVGAIDAILDSLKNTYCKAYTYHVFDRVMVRDGACNIFNGHRSYFQKCFNDALKSRTKLQQTTEKYAYQYCYNYFFDSLRISVDGKRYWEYKYDGDEFGAGLTRRMTFGKYIIPRRWRAMSKKYGILLPDEFKKKCDVCNVIERYHFSDHMNIESEDRKCVDKIYNCPCKAFYFCSRKCQKIGWSHKDFLHRNECSFIKS